jgi:hypothetical protein
MRPAIALASSHRPCFASEYTSQNSRAAIAASARIPPEAPMGSAGSSAEAAPTIT